jgi:hypothetical protein
LARITGPYTLVHPGLNRACRGSQCFPCYAITGFEPVEIDQIARDPASASELRLAEGFKHQPLKHPVIVVLDNDNGAKEIFGTLSKSFGISIGLKSAAPFFHVTDNLYLVKTPEMGRKAEIHRPSALRRFKLSPARDGERAIVLTVRGSQGSATAPDFRGSVLSGCCSVE